MNRVLTAIGLAGTVVYIFLAYFLIGDGIGQIHTLKLNEIGDFLAGVFGPLAILWLILGFFQQGIELKQSTKALELQAKELNNSVKQQKELVEVSRQQVEAEIQALHYERQKYTAQAKPNFIFHGVSVTQFGGERVEYRTTIQNTGSTVNTVKFFTDIAMKKIVPKSLPVWEQNRKIDLSWAYADSVIVEETVLEIRYEDSMGVLGIDKFKLIGSRKPGGFKIDVEPILI